MAVAARRGGRGPLSPGVRRAWGAATAAGALSRPARSGSGGTNEASLIFEARCMIVDILDIVAAPRSARVVRATLSARRINTTFAEVRNELGARTLHTEVRKRDRA